MQLKRPKCWYLTADAGRATAYARRQDGRGYEAVASWESDLIRPRDERPQYTDKPGRVFDSTGGNRHATETVSPAELAKRAFGRALAEALNAARAKGAFDVLVLFGAPRLMHHLQQSLDRPTADAVVYRRAKDLTKLPAGQLAAKFDSIGLNAAPRAPARAAGANRR